MLEHQHPNARQPRQKHRHQIPEPGQLNRPDAPPRHKNQVTVGRKVPGEENRQGNLRDLTRLEGAARNGDPDARTVNFLTNNRQQRQHQQNKGQRQRNVGDLTQHPVIPQEVDNHGAGEHRQARPKQLRVTHRVLQIRVDTVNHGQTDTVEHNHDR